MSPVNNPATPKSAVTVRIAGEEHTIRSEAAPDHTRACARYVDDTVTEIRQTLNLVESQKAVILAALSITDQLFCARREGERLGSELAARLQALTRRIEEALDPDATLR